MEDGGVKYFKLGSLFMQPVSMRCTRITNLFKHGQYSNQRNAFIQHDIDFYSTITHMHSLDMLSTLM